MSSFSGVFHSDGPLPETLEVLHTVDLRDRPPGAFETAWVIQSFYRSISSSSNKHLKDNWTRAFRSNLVLHYAPPPTLGLWEFVSHEEERIQQGEDFPKFWGDFIKGLRELKASKKPLVVRVVGVSDPRVLLELATQDLWFAIMPTPPPKVIPQGGLDVVTVLQGAHRDL